MARTCWVVRSCSASCSIAGWPGSSRRSTTMRWRRPPSTGTSWTSSGSRCSRRSTCSDHRRIALMIMRPRRAMLVGLVFGGLGMVYGLLSHDWVGVTLLLALGVGVGLRGLGRRAAAPGGDEIEEGGAGEPAGRSPWDSLLEFISKLVS